MIFGKKKKTPDMVDVRELQRRGVVRIPKKHSDIPTNSKGFIEVGQTKPSPVKKTSTVSNTDFFGFANTVKPTTKDKEQITGFSNSPDGYNKREVDQKITNLDNKIYKLEQRLELLEKKLDVNQAPSPAIGPMGW